MICFKHALTVFVLFVTLIYKMSSQPTGMFDGFISGSYSSSSFSGGNGFSSAKNPQDTQNKKESSSQSSDFYVGSLDFVNDMMGSMKSNMGGFFDGGSIIPDLSKPIVTMPCQESFENGNFKIECDVQGYKDEEIKLDISDNGLTINGHRAASDNNDGGANSQFQQSFYSSKYDTKKLVRKFSNGVLTITIPQK